MPQHTQVLGSQGLCLGIPSFVDEGLPACEAWVFSGCLLTVGNRYTVLAYISGIGAHLDGLVETDAPFAHVRGGVGPGRWEMVGVICHFQLGRIKLTEFKGSPNSLAVSCRT